MRGGDMLEPIKSVQDLVSKLGNQDVKIVNKGMVYKVDNAVAKEL